MGKLVQLVANSIVLISQRLSDLLPNYKMCVCIKGKFVLKCLLNAYVFNAEYECYIWVLLTCWCYVLLPTQTIFALSLQSLRPSWLLLDHFANFVSEDIRVL